MSKKLKIGTRESQLALWQAQWVQDGLAKAGIESELVLIKSDGDIDLVTPLYALGVQGVFTKTLDAALLSGKIDIAVHSMKDVPTQLAQGIAQAAVLKRASYKDLFVCKNVQNQEGLNAAGLAIATSSIRRKAQWLHRYPSHTIENLRGNVNTRLRKVAESNWAGAIFAAAGLERINLRPEQAIELDWMLPAPAQGAVMVVCKEEDVETKKMCSVLHDEPTAICVQEERDFLKTLMGGCSTPISALAEIKTGMLHFKGNIFSLDGKQKLEIEKQIPLAEAMSVGTNAANELLNKGARELTEQIRNAAR
ncbi:MAG: hydroxymethylbilane synthase [Bacteroidota bacterium]|nr:hydroxymethylbilane synthase [Bacteroidota bacterium]